MSDIPAPDFSPAISETAQGTVVAVWAVPGASRTEIVGMHGDTLRIRVSAPADDGRANRALANVLASLCDGEVELVAGRRGRRKVFLVKGVRAADFLRRVSRQ